MHFKPTKFKTNTTAAVEQEQSSKSESGKSEGKALINHSEHENKNSPGVVAALRAALRQRLCLKKSLRFHYLCSR